MKTSQALLMSIGFAAMTLLCRANQLGEVTADLSAPRRAIDNRIYGQFIEHFGRIIQGGLWAELLANRKFYPIDTQRTQVAEPWKPEADRLAVSYVIDRFESLDHISSQRVSLFGTARTWRGIAQTGFDVLGQKDYVAYAWIKTDSPGSAVAFRLESNEPASQVQATATLEGRGWRKYEVRLKPAQDLKPAVFRLLFSTPGTYWIGAVSLMPADNVEGMRKDVLDLVKAMSPTMIRWPGGGYPDGYDWRTAIGPRDNRPPQPIVPFGQPNGYDNGIDPNDFGTDEYLRFCQIIGTAPYITANFGSGTPAMAADWVEYTNGPSSSKWGAARAANGHPEAYGVKNWSIGNEIWGDPFESGHTTAEGYTYFLDPMIQAMRDVDPHISITAVGERENATGADKQWNATVIGDSWRDIDFLSVHHYYPSGTPASAFVDHPLDFYYSVVADPWVTENKLLSLSQKIDGLTGAPGKVKLALDEWSEWDWDFPFPAGLPDRSALNQFIDLIGKSGLEFNHTERDALFDARMLHVLMRISDQVPISARTHMINSLGAIRTDSTRSFLTASGVVMELYRKHSGSALVPAMVSSGTFDVPELGWKGIPYLDATVTCANNKLYVHLMNLHATETMDVHLRLLHGKIQSNGISWSIAPQDFMARNDFSITNVRIAREVRTGLSSDMVEHLPPHSIVTLEMEMQ